MLSARQRIKLMRLVQRESKLIAGVLMKFSAALLLMEGIVWIAAGAGTRPALPPVAAPHGVAAPATGEVARHPAPHATAGVWAPAVTRPLPRTVDPAL